MNSAAAHRFDRFADKVRWNTFNDQERRILAEFVQRWDVKPGQHVLEPGCGTGRLTAILTGLTGETGRVVAFDASPDLIRIALGRRLPPQARFHVAHAETFAFEPGTFDHVLCFNVFPHLVPHAVIARRLATALRPGGVFWIAHTCGRDAVNRVHRSERGMRNHLLPEPNQLKRLLRVIGLADVGIEDEEDRFLVRAVRPPSDPSRRSHPCDAAG